MYQNNKRYPAKKKNYNSPSKYNKPKNNMVTTQNFFQGNLAQQMNFGGKDHDISGYVQRTLVIKDSHGNVQIAKERQFFNSGKNIGRIKINGHESDF